MKKKCQRNEIEELAEKIDEKAGALAGEDAESAAVRDASVAGLSAAAHLLRTVAAVQKPCGPEMEDDDAEGIAVPSEAEKKP